MKYKNIKAAEFISRPNRFIAKVLINGSEETVHVKNTGRCRELLINGCDIWLTAPGTPGRKTRYDLVAVRKDNGMIINIDSQAPNKAVGEWLGQRGYDRIVHEYPFGESRIDFYMERGSEHFLMEVKGCTLEVDGTGFFARRDIHAVKAKAKAGKTTTLKVFIAALLLGVMFRVKSLLENPRIVFFDTEQNRKDTRGGESQTCRRSRYLDARRGGMDTQPAGQRRMLHALHSRLCAHHTCRYIIIYRQGEGHVRSG